MLGHTVARLSSAAAKDSLALVCATAFAGPQYQRSSLAHALDKINRATFEREVRFYVDHHGWIDRGEKAAIGRVSEQFALGPVLDIGVGGGRTAELLKPIPKQYIGIDYVPEMVAAVRRRFPGVCVAARDARALAFPDASFRAVWFSANGIDNTGETDRLVILREIYRVLAPGGVFVFTALNLEGPSARKCWWNVWREPHLRAGVRSALRGVRWMIAGALGRSKYAPLLIEGRDTAIVNVPAHGFRLVNMLTSWTEQIRQLQAAGFHIMKVYDTNGGAVTCGTDRTKDDWLHYLAYRAEFDESAL